ncbi:hypothetical protein [Allobranchiibius sp. GilTou38]|uniref:hypothetical protein n=1 Tax=Allobranchiibius sp. GilTou38 TaxID=2815210 RepID=UPI001AA15B1B|nr:hypothetical protein [Allobranchiibius sp. GilTou38]MBO1766786.1 hypothetical protein [Allobranchiibius sp. GilTou38]
MRSCPVCGGSQLVGHPAGWLAIDHATPCAIRDFEDATRAADYGRGYANGSPAERTIGVDVPLLNLGTATVTCLPDDATALPGDTRGYARDATPTERALLVALGYATTEPVDGAAGALPVLPIILRTVVQAPTLGGAIIRRQWPQLETRQPPQAAA